MPRPGDPKPGTSGQIGDIVVQELVNNGLIEEKANGACAVTRSGREYYEKHLKNRT
jgi:predicted transcriptional regulator